MTPTVALLSLGGPEMIWIFVLMLLLFGAKKLPGLARSIGEGLGQFKSARDEFERELRYAELDAAHEEEQKLPKIETPKESRLEIGSEDGGENGGDVKDEYAYDDYHHDYHDHDYHHDEHDGHGDDGQDNHGDDADNPDHAPQNPAQSSGDQPEAVASSEEEKATPAATPSPSSHA
ncbi:MAG: twin-arginine translocase TatA/TatE family subunit [Verrucomicrobiales bacterium]|nr:twin-arginine translocase TatA/TatE family subunit [Verrucomicrobiales bacterium]